MTRVQFHLKNLSLGLASAVLLGAAFLPGSAVQAQTVLDEQGSLRPSQDEYKFTGEAGQVLSISMVSADFDTVLTLISPTGEEVAFNDDFGRSLNSTIVTTIPADGEYTVIAKSFSGQGGDYTLSVRPATEYEQAYSEGLTYSMDGQFDQAIAAYTRAIEVDADQPAAYMDRAEARWSQVYAAQGLTEGEEPQAPTGEARDAIVADYTRAAELYEQQGETDLVQSLREQITFLESQP
jgi:tetratricopeptide (TPR) repeat protein